MKFKLVPLIVIFLTMAFNSAYSQSPINSPFSKIAENEIPALTLERRIVPQQYSTYQLNINKLQNILSAAPKRKFPNTEVSEVILTLPTPNGNLENFVVYYDPIMEAGLETKFPEIKTYFGASVTDPSATVRFDFTPFGFHAMILANDKDPIFIDPYYHENTLYYTVYNKKDYVKPSHKDYLCGFDDLEENIEFYKQKINNNANNGDSRAGTCGQLRTYRLALACTVEYSTYFGGTVANALAAQVVTMNRVNGIYEKDLSVRMNIIADNWKVIYATGPSGPTGTTNYTTATDPFTNSSGTSLLTQNQTTCDANILTANYDIGHIFSTGGGGVATLNSPCSSTTKARGVTGSSAPVGDPFDVDYVAHEMGHQFGGPHTFAAGSSTTGSCSSTNVSTSNAYEPGSGTTIQAYAGICSPVNVQSNSDPYFHAASLGSITTFLAGAGGTCPVTTTTGNTSPTANAGLDYSIPISTPFTLTGVATDPEGDALTGCWEQMDAAVISTAPTGTATTGSLFRSLNPTTNLSRTIPKLADITSNAVTTWEKLPSVARSINMRFTVRDNKPGGGCTAEDNMVISVINTGAAFAVSYPTLTGVTWTGLETYNVTWAVTGTNATPINCATVKISLSTDGGVTYPTILATNVPNTGTAAVVCPNPTATITTARIKVEGENNIFFDISNNNFTIVIGGPNYSINCTNPSQAICNTTNPDFNITTTSQQSYSDNITFSTSGLPAGVNASFSATTVNPGSPSTLSLTGISGLAAGNYAFSLNATSTVGTKALPLSFQVFVTPSSPTLSTPANGATAVATSPTFTWAAGSNATTYNLQVASDAGFSNLMLNQTNISSTTYTFGGVLPSNTVFYWKAASVNVCNATGSPIFSAANSFTTDPTACTTVPSANVPITISTSGTPIVYSTVNVTANGTLNDVDVMNIVGTHTYIADLRVSIKSPISATYVTLWSQLCTSNANFNISFDDESTRLYNTIACPMTGGLTYRPSALLSAFDGQNLNGTWTLRIEDLSNQDGGSLTGWGPKVCALNLVLPVTLSDFRATPKNNTIALWWKTELESNNKGFEILRSEDFNQNFEKIGFVEANLSKNTNNSYDFTDKNVIKGKTYYYRLRQIDTDGRENLSEIKAASLKGNGIWDIALSPNPVSDFFFLQVFSSEKENKQIEIFSIDGKSIKRFETYENEMNIEVESLPQGIYTLKIISNGEQFVKKFFKK